MQGLGFDETPRTRAKEYSFWFLGVVQGLLLAVGGFRMDAQVSPSVSRYSLCPHLGKCGDTWGVDEKHGNVQPIGVCLRGNGDLGFRV